MVKFSRRAPILLAMGDVPGSAAWPRAWLRVQEAAELLGVSASTMRRWADAGKVASHRSPGGQRIFARDDLDALLPVASRALDASSSSSGLERERRMALLLEATRAVTSTLVLEDVLTLVARTTAEAMGTFAADIFDYSAADNAMVASACDLPPFKFWRRWDGAGAVAGRDPPRTPEAVHSSFLQAQGRFYQGAAAICPGRRGRGADKGPKKGGRAHQR